MRQFGGHKVHNGRFLSPGWSALELEIKETPKKGPGEKIVAGTWYDDSYWERPPKGSCVLR